MELFSEEWDDDQFSDYLKSSGLHEDVISAIVDNRVSSKLFLESEADLKELAPSIGDRLYLRKILEEARKV